MIHSSVRYCDLETVLFWEKRLLKGKKDYFSLLSDINILTDHFLLHSANIYAIL